MTHAILWIAHRDRSNEMRMTEPSLSHSKISNFILIIQFATDHRETNSIQFLPIFFSLVSQYLTWNYVFIRSCEWRLINVRWHMGARTTQGTRHAHERKRNSTNGNKRTSALPSYSSGIVLDIRFSLLAPSASPSQLGESVTFLIIQMVCCCCCYF